MSATGSSTKNSIVAMVVIRRSCKDVDINVRHSISLSGNDRHQMEVLRNLVIRLDRLKYQIIEQNDLISAGIIGRYVIVTMDRYNLVSTVVCAQPILYNGDRYRFDSPLLQNGMLAATYRFKNRDQLQQLIDGLKIPEYLVNPADRCSYHREELILIVLERCALGARLLDLQNKYHRNHAAIGIAISFFCAWMQEHWGYLLHDHLNFWQPYLKESRDNWLSCFISFYESNYVKTSYVISWNISVRVRVIIWVVVIMTQLP